MNQKAQQRLTQIEQQRTELIGLLDDPNLTPTERLEITRRVLHSLQETTELQAGNHPLRGNTTNESKELFEAVQRELAGGGKVIR